MLVFEGKHSFEQYGIELDVQAPFIFRLHNEQEAKKTATPYGGITDDSIIIKSWDVSYWLEQLQSGHPLAVEALFCMKTLQYSPSFQNFQINRERIVKSLGKQLYKGYMSHFDMRHDLFLEKISIWDAEQQCDVQVSINKEFIKAFRLLDVLERYAVNQFSSFEDALVYSDQAEFEVDSITSRFLQDIYKLRRKDDIFSPISLNAILLKKRQLVSSLWQVDNNPDESKLFTELILQK